METESSAFLSGFCNYYSVISGEDVMATSSTSFGTLDNLQRNWTEGEVTSASNQDEVLEYLEYYEECPTDGNNLEVITIQSLEGEKIISNTDVDYFLSDPPESSVMDLDCLTDSCPFDWDLNLENLITTKVLPDLSPVCSEFLTDAVQELPIDQQPLRLDTDTSTKPTFQCNYGQCRKVYAKAAHLRSHIRRHLGDKPYICTWHDCSWRFNRSDELARHRRSHSGHKPYGCDYCPKRFSRSDHLSKHRKVHERKFASGKAKGVWRVLPKAKPGRKPKALKQLEEMNNNNLPMY